METYDHLLKNSPSWVRYLVLRDLAGATLTELQGLHSQVFEEPYVQGLLAAVKNFHVLIVSGHKSPSLNVNKLLMLQSLDFGLETPQIETAMELILAQRDNQGVYRSRCLVSTSYGGTGLPDFGWALCDAPLLLLAVFQAGMDYTEYVKPGLDALSSLQFEKGFPCAVSKELGKWRGPGRKSDPCPIATLWMLRLFAALPSLRDSAQARSAAEAILSLWEHSWEEHPYMFSMGTDFRKLKAPAVWYDIVSVCDVLRQLPWLSEDSRFQQMKQVILAKQNEEGLFTPESIYLACKAEDFGQKKLPSAYLSFLCQRILHN
ncbi:MAG TPA: hypothetical protein VLR89_08755 [Anaerolineaceae bacterium]|nr:hypothetical protein [Anaerolineaceae bacterium]